MPACPSDNTLARVLHRSAPAIRCNPSRTIRARSFARTSPLDDPPNWADHVLQIKNATSVRARVTPVSDPDRKGLTRPIPDTLGPQLSSVLFFLQLSRQGERPGSLHQEQAMSHTSSSAAAAMRDQAALSHGLFLVCLLPMPRVAVEGDQMPIFD